MLKTALKVGALMIACAWLVEVIFCYLILPQRLEYIESSYRRFPHFWLVPSYESRDVVIADGRRRVRSTGEPGDGIAFVGDSVTFGSGVDQAATLPQLVADRLPGRLVHNYGVPGYGLLEYLRVVEDRLAQGHYRHVVINLLGNDVYPASGGRLPILIRGGETITYWNLHESGLSGYAKYLLFRYFKAGYFVLLSTRRSAEAGTAAAPRDGPAPSPEQCNADLRRDGEADQPIHERHQRMYADPRLRAAVAHAVARLAFAIRRKGAEPVFMIHYAYWDLANDGPNEFRTAMTAAATATQAPLIDLYELHKASFRGNECAYFVDPLHSGRLHNEHKAVALVERLQALTQAP